MNHAYRLIWNHALDAYVPAPECARGRGKQSRGKALAAAVLYCLAFNALGLPQDGQVSVGQGTIATAGNAMTVTQSTRNLAVNWHSFNISQGEKVSFVQPDSSAIALNRVLGTDPSGIYGSLQANGQVFLLNPNGILFGPGAQVNVGGLVASTLALSDQDFAAGRYSFRGTGGSVTNQGTITAQDGGYVALLGGQVSNAGTIAARLGTVALAAGNQLSLDFAGDRLLSLQVDQGTLQALVQNRQLIQADGGQVILTAKAADQLLSSLVNNDGVIQARSVSTRHGVIRLEGDNLANLGTLDASGELGGRITLTGQGIVQAGTLHADGDGGAVTVDAAHLALQTASGQVTANGLAQGGTIRFSGSDSALVSGDLSASGQLGGAITVTATQINLAAATLKADGLTQGGAIRIGGDAHGTHLELPNALTTKVNPYTRLSAQGTGGKIVVWSDTLTDYRGQAATGDRGFIEVSSKGTLNYGGQTNAGQGGQVLLDPTNLIISDTVSDQRYLDLADPNPQSGVQHGSGTIVQLANGNIVVTSPNAMIGSTQGGAAFLYNGQTGALISALYGGTSGDQIGSSGALALAGSNVVVGSPNWNNGSTILAGAVTWFNGSSGLSGFVTAANSMTGSAAYDRVGQNLLLLPNGNYLVGSPYWRNGSATEAGAVTFGYANQPTAGVVSTANSLVGSTTDDHVGANIIALSQGNAVTWSNVWHNGAVTNAGAVTWMSQDTPTVGVVGPANSMVGSSTNDFVGADSDGKSGIVTLSNGNVLVFSKHWHTTPDTDTGAISWMSGARPTVGAVDATNSMIGSTPADKLGWVSDHPYGDKPGYVELPSGNVVVASQYWNNSAGAATWMSGTGPTAGVIGAGNSLIGSTAGDQVAQGAGGGGSLRVLANGNYVVIAPYWDNGATADAGAVTWGNGSTGTVGVIGAANSLVGSNANDRVGSHGVTALTNGHYVVNSPYWSDGVNPEVGASTWGNGNGGTVGAISAANSLVGSSAYDHVGLSSTALTNGHYVVTNQHWNDATNGRSTVGAVTWANGNGSTVGAVSAANSMIGDTADDQVGNGGVIALAGGNYLVKSPQWHDSSGNTAWRDGSAASTGTFDSSNAMIGTMDPTIKVLSNGKFVLNNPFWASGGRGYVAVGSNDGSFVGTIDSTTALIGGYNRAWLGHDGGITDLGNGNFVVYSRMSYGPGTVAFAGSVIFGNSNAPVVGVANASNTLYGSARLDQLGQKGVTVLPNHDYVVSFPTWDGIGGSQPDSGAVIIGSGTTGLTGYISASNALFGVNAGDLTGSLIPFGGGGSGIQVLAGNDFLVRSPFATVNGNGSAGRLWLLREGTDFATSVNSSAGNQTLSPGAIAKAAVAGSTLTLQASNDITVNSAVAVDGALKLVAGNALTLNAGITSLASGTAIELAGQSFTNNVGSGALSTPNGRWLVWSGNPANDSRGGLAYDFKQYNAAYGSTTVAESGNGFLYSLAPTITARLVGSVSKTYDGTATTALSAANYAFSGSVDGDTVVVSTPTAGTYDSANAGAHKTVSASGLALTSAENDGKPVYGYRLASTTASGKIGTIDPKALSVTAGDQATTYGTALALGTTAFTASGLINGDRISDVTLQQNGNATVPATQGAGSYRGNLGIQASAASGSGLSNYAITYTPGTLTIAPKDLVVTANSTGKTYDAQSYAGGSGVSYQGFVNNETAAALGGVLSYSGSAQGARNVGSYSITPGGYFADNYAISYANGTLNIAPAAITLSTSDVIKYYDGSNWASGKAAVTAGSLMGSDQLAGGTYAFIDPAVGTHKTVTVAGITVNDGNGGNNYAVTYANNTTSAILPEVTSATLARDFPLANNSSPIGGTQLPALAPAGGAEAVADDLLSAGLLQVVSSGMLLPPGLDGNDLSSTQARR